MRIGLPLLVLLLLTAAPLVGPHPARAGETPDAGADPVDAVRAERAAAAAIGRALLSPDAAVRRRAIERLEARIARGGDLRPFLETLARAAGDWADRRERLLDRWLDQARHGSAAERAEAARLIHALGPDATARLLEVLRQAEGLAREPSTPPPPAAEPTAQAPAEPQDEDAAGDTAAEDDDTRPQGEDEPGWAMHFYDLRDLGTRGMNPLELRSMLQKVPDAHEVREIGRHRYGVRATPEGHAALRAHLHGLRTGQVRQHAAGPRTADASRARWRFAPHVFRVPRSAVTTDDGPAQGLTMKAGGLPRGLDPDETQVYVGSRMDAAIWMRALQHVPNGVRAEQPRGEPLAAPDETRTFFTGREQDYRKGIVRNPGGQWAVAMGRLQLGIELEISPHPTDGGLEVRVRATRTEVVEPMAVDRVPAPPGEPIEVDRPDWSIARAEAEALLPTTGGAAFLSLAGIGRTDAEHVIVVLLVEPVEADDAK